MRQPPPLSLEDHPAGVEPGTVLMDLDDLNAAGSADLTLKDGDHMLRILVQQTEDGLVVFENRCPHAGTPLNMFDEGFLDLSGKKLICRTHGAQFSPANGKCTRGPCKGLYLRAIAVHVAEGKLVAD